MQCPDIDYDQGPATLAPSSRTLLGNWFPVGGDSTVLAANGVKAGNTWIEVTGDIQAAGGCGPFGRSSG